MESKFKNKTYEEIFGDDKAKIVKENHSKALKERWRNLDNFEKKRLCDITKEVSK